MYDQVALTKRNANTNTGPGSSDKVKWPGFIAGGGPDVAGSAGRTSQQEHNQHHPRKGCLRNRMVAATFLLLPSMLYRLYTPITGIINDEKNKSSEPQSIVTIEHLRQQLKMSNPLSPLSKSSASLVGDSNSTLPSYSAPDYVKSFRPTFGHGSGHNPQGRGSLGRPTSLSFVHIPKTGGASIETVAATTAAPTTTEMSGSSAVHWGVCMFPSIKYAKWCKAKVPFGSSAVAGIGGGGSWTKMSWWHLPRYAFPLLRVDPYLDTISFSVVRDAYSAVISDFHYICTAGDTTRRCPIRDKEKFNDWIRQHVSSTDNTAKLLKRRWIGHMVPHYLFVVEPVTEVRYVDYVLRIENLSKEFNSLMKAYGLDHLRLDENADGHHHGSSSRHNRSVSDARFKNMNTSITNMVNQNNLKTFNVNDLEKKTIKQINDAYADDFNSFGYNIQKTSS